jgi:putative (di)nucleoside polyphosphate hydrolase
VAVVTNSQGEVLAFERSDVPGAWQLPQGGIDVGEEPGDAAWRELGEETGLGPDEVDLLGEHPDWVVYEFPDQIRSAGKRLGQAQRWYLFRVRSDDVIPTPDEVEFVAWKWVEPAWLLEHVVEFRLAAYRAVIPRLLP